MWICPECATPLAGGEDEGAAPSADAKCPGCGFAPELREGIADFRPRPERARPSAVFSPEPLDASPSGLVRHAGDLAGRAVCDLGAGDGGLARRLRDTGAASVVAIDGDPGALAALGGEARITPIVAGLESLPFREHFDVLVCRGALERVVNVASLLHSLNRAVRVGGRLVVQAADRPDWMRWAPGGAAAGAPPPLRTLDRGVLCDLVTSAAFELERVEEGEASRATARSGGHGLLVVRARKRATFG